MMKMKRIFPLALAVLLLCAGAAFAAELPPDVAGTPYEQAVKTLQEKGIVTGDVDGMFYPDSKLTRAQACVMVAKAMKPAEVELRGTATQPVESGFSDMSGYGWAEGYIAYAVKQGVVRGYPDGTFRPAASVTLHELTAMAVRAAGYKDSQLTGAWPEAFAAKAKELGFYDGISVLPAGAQEASKGVTAQVLRNALSKIEAAHSGQSSAGKATPSAVVPTLEGKTFVTGSFNSTMTEVDGKKLSPDAAVYATGKKADYSSAMTLSTKTEDFRQDTVYKYKNVTTPLWYAMEGDRITSLILPMDVGFSGQVYGVINETSSLLNASGEKVIGIRSLVAGREITWLGTAGLAAPVDTLNGDVIQMDSRDGQIRGFVKAGDSAGDGFIELTGGSFQKIFKADAGVLRLVNADGALLEIKENAVVYVLSSDKKAYTASSHSSLREGKSIRAYDITDDSDASADMVVVWSAD